MEGGERKKKKGKREKRKGSRGREHSFPIYMHSQNRAESIATRKRTVGTRAAGCGVGATTSCLRRANGQPRLTCGLCAPGPPSASVPPEQLLPGPSPVKMESSSGPLRFCSRALMRPFFLKMSLTRLTPSTSLYSSAIPFSFKVNFYWSRVALQCCVSFCWTAKQISFKVLKW